MKNREGFTRVKQGLGAAVLALVFLFFMGQTFLPALSQQTHGFAAYYTGAWMLAHGQATQLYDPTVFNAAMQQSGIGGIYDLYDANAPLLAALTLPLAFFSPAISRLVWLWLNLGLLLAAFFPATRLAGRGGWWPFCLTGTFLLLYAPLRENFRLGQMYMPFLLAACLSLAFSGAAGKGLALALELVLKLYYGFFGFLAGINQPRSIAVGLALTAGLGLALLPWLGFGLWLDYARLAGGFAGRPETAVTAYQTFNGFFTHLFRYDARWNPQPIVDLPWLARLLTILVDATLVMSSSYLIWRAYRKGLFEGKSGPALTRLVTALALTLAPLLAPVAEEYHFTLLALPLLVTSSKFKVQSSKFKTGLDEALQGSKFYTTSSAGVQSSRFKATLNFEPETLNSILWWVSMGLLALPWPYKEWPAGGWQALIAYPRLYGALVLWYLLLRLIRVQVFAEVALPLDQNLNRGE